MAEYIFKIDAALFNEESGEVAMKPEVQGKLIRCKNCKYFEYDHPYIVYGIPVIGHLVCNKWGDGCRTAEDGYCFMAERREKEGHNELD